MGVIEHRTFDFLCVEPLAHENHKDSARALEDHGAIWIGRKVFDASGVKRDVRRPLTFAIRCLVYAVWPCIRKSCIHCYASR